MTTPASDHPIGFLAGVRAILRLSLTGVAWTRRGFFVGTLLGLPVLLGVLVHWLGQTPRPSPTMGTALFDKVMTYYYLCAALPLAALFSAAPLIAEELESKTITYLFTRPVSRASILSGKLAVYAVGALTFALPAVVLSYFALVSLDGLAAIGAHASGLGRALGAAALAVVTYGALFALAGILFRRPLVLGVGLFAWERVVYWIGPGSLPRLTLSAYLVALVDGSQPVASSLAVLFAATLAFALGAALVFGRREYVLEQ